MRELYTEISPNDCQEAYEKYINAHMVPLGKSAFEAGWNAALQLVAARMEYVSETAYSTGIFTEVSDERKKELGGEVDRLSAAMGRHLLHWWAEECKAGMTTAVPQSRTPFDPTVVSSGIAAALIRERLEAGDTIEIPSLGITIMTAPEPPVRNGEQDEST